MLEKIIQRLKSPVVIIQLVTILGTAVVLVVPELDNTVKTIVGVVSAIVNAFAGLNNPTSKSEF